MNCTQALRSVLGTGLMLVATCGGFACGRTSPAQVDEGQGVASAFLDELRAGRVDPAWQASTVEFKSLMGAESLRDYVRTHPALKAKAEFVASQPVEASSGRRVNYQFQATPPPTRTRSKTPPGPATIRVMLDFATSPPKVERLAVE